MEEFDHYTLKNGIRIVHKQISHTKVAHCGFFLDIGTRDEDFSQQGIAHFWEHMAFKGTRKRKSFHILNRLEVYGGELNAYTTKEKIVFYASVLDEHFEKAAELLTDITFESVFPPKEIEKERGVILEEMSMYYDNPEEAVVDDFETAVFKNHPLGYNILGTPETVKSISREDFKSFLKRNLDTEKIVFASMGNIPFKEVKALADKYFKDIPKMSSKGKRLSFRAYKPKRVEVKRPITQSHTMIGQPAYGLKSNKRLPFFMLVNLLGGPAMSSRLNMELRERHGLVYAVDSHYTPFTDTGLFYIYFGTEKKQVEKSTKLVLNELKKLRTVSLGTQQLHTCKEQLIGQLAIAEESNVHIVQMMGKSILDLDSIESLNEIFRKIRKVSASDLMEIANECFQEDDLSFLTYLPD